MKRRIASLLLALVMVLGLAVNVSAYEEYTCGDWTYTLVNSGASITGYTGSDAELVIPATLDGHNVVSIDDNALWYGSYTSIQFPATLRTIGTGAFMECRKLTSVEIPGTVTSIHSMAFYNCFSLTSVTLGDGITTVGGGAFQCTGLTSVTIPASVTSIGHQAFGIGTEESYDDYVDDFVIYGVPGSAAEEYAAEFHRTFVPIAGENKDMCGVATYWTFDETTGKLTVSGSGGIFDFDTDNKAPWHSFKDQITTVEIRNGVSYIGEDAFFECRNLTSVTLPDTLVSIGGNAFAYCRKLSQVNFPFGLENIGWQAFVRTALTQVELPDTLWLIQGCAFAGCEQLTYVKLPKALVDVGEEVFRGCTALTTVVMPKMSDLESLNTGLFLDCDGLTNVDFVSTSLIGNRMFAACDGLTELTFPAHTWVIGQLAFNWCVNLRTVTIHENIYWIQEAAFANCESLNTVIFQGNAPSIELEAFRDDTLTAYYPAGNDTWTEDVLQNYGGNITWVAYEPLDFTDVPVNTFYYAPVAWALENNITTGTTATTFNPSGECMRAQIVTFLWRAAGSPVVEAENPFTDVKETDFYYNAVLWAVENGITTGTSDTTFSPTKTCSRAEVVTFLWRANGKPDASAANPFEDVADTDFFHTAVLWAVEKGITNGMDAAHFGSLNICNRAQVVTFLYRTNSK